MKDTSDFLKLCRRKGICSETGEWFLCWCPVWQSAGQWWAGLQGGSVAGWLEQAAGTGRHGTHGTRNTVSFCHPLLEFHPWLWQMFNRIAARLVAGASFCAFWGKYQSPCPCCLLCVLFLLCFHPALGNYIGEGTCTVFSCARRYQELQPSPGKEFPAVSPVCAFGP